MAFPLIPVAIGLLVAGAAVAVSRRKPNQGEMTPERQTIFESAINSVQDPAKLRALAASFRSAGLEKEAQALEGRADHRELPSDVKAERAQVFRDAMSSQNPQAVLRVADAFEQEGAIGAASALRAYAAKLQLSQVGPGGTNPDLAPGPVKMS